MIEGEDWPIVHYSQIFVGKSMMDAATQAIYQEILRVARSGGITTYADIAPLAELDMSLLHHRTRIGSILGEISRAEHRAGRPMLSAVVILADRNRPGQGFFRLAKTLGLHTGGDELQFWVQELQRVHDYWS